MEILEKRLAPAGLITVILTDGTLKLTGDALDNRISVREMGPDLIEVEGVAGTLISLNGAAGVTGLTIAGVGKGLTIDLKEGNDELQLQDLTLSGNVSVQMGGGDNFVSLGTMNIGGNLSVAGGKGADEIGDENGSIRVAGTTTFALGDGDNRADISSDTSTMFFGGAFSYTGGTGEDGFGLSAASLHFGAGVTVKTGAGEGALYLSATGGLKVTGAVSFQALDHPGTESEFTLQAANIDITGGVTVKHGAGGSDTTMEAANRLSIGGAVAVTNGNTPGENEVSIEADDIAIGGSFTVTNGTGVNHVGLEGRVVIDGSVSITNGVNGTGNRTSTDITGDSLEIGGGLTISNKGGLSDNFIRSTDIDIGGKIAITNAGTGVISGLAASNTNISPENNSINSSLSAAGIAITNGAGNFITTVAVGQGYIGGNLAIVNGNSTTDSNGNPQGLTLNSIKGDLHVTGNVSITNGNGRFSNLIGNFDLHGSEAANSLFAGGGVTMTNGNAAMAYHALTVDHVYAKSLTLKNGNALAADAVVNIIEVEDLRVATALSITNGNTSSTDVMNNVANTLTAVTFADVGSLTIKNGNGANQTDVTAPVLNIRGAVSLTSGKAGAGAENNFTFTSANRFTVGGVTGLTTGDGDSRLTIVAADSHFGGKVSLTFGGTGNDVVGIADAGQTLFAGGGFVIKANAGNSYVTIGGGSMTSLNILGGVSYTALAGTDGLTITGDGRISGAVSLNFGSGLSGTLNLSGREGSNGYLHMAGAIAFTAGADSGRTLNLYNASVAAVSLTGGTATDTLSIVDTQIRGALTLDLKEGDDSVYLDDATVLGAVNILTGAGADGIYVETYNIFAGTTTFHGAVNFNLGANNDELFIAQGEVPEISVSFLSTAKFDGGAPTSGNVLSQGANITYASSPTLLNFPA